MKITNLIETQRDGYKAVLRGNIVEISLGSKKKSMNCTHFKLFDESNMPDYIKCKIPNDKRSGLWGYCGGIPIRLRDIGDAVKIVSDLRSEINLATKQKNETVKKEINDKINLAKVAAESQLNESVELINIIYYDGYPNKIMARDIEIDLIVNYKKSITVDGFSFMTTVDIDEAIKQALYKQEQIKLDNLKKKQIKLDKQSELIELAKKTGKKQIYNQYTSNYCLDNLVDCSFDNVTVWIDATGNLTETYSHCY